jgi:hypothetical protein
MYEKIVDAEFGMTVSSFGEYIESIVHPVMRRSILSIEKKL